jgi:hypothetical protein
LFSLEQSHILDSDYRFVSEGGNQTNLVACEWSHRTPHQNHYADRDTLT